MNIINKLLQYLGADKVKTTVYKLRDGLSEDERKECLDEIYQQYKKNLDPIIQSKIFYNKYRVTEWFVNNHLFAVERGKRGFSKNEKTN